MFSYDFIIVREILPEKGYLSILKEYVVVKSMSKFRLFILENHFRNYLQFQTLYLYWRHVREKVDTCLRSKRSFKNPQRRSKDEHCVLFISSNMNKESWTVIFFISERGWFQVPVFMFLQNDIINISKIIRHVILHIIRKWETADPASN